MQDSLNEAIEAIGGVTEVSRRMGVSVTAVYKWKRTKLPPERVLQVEALSGVSRHRLRPDIFGAPEAA